MKKTKQKSIHHLMPKGWDEEKKKRCTRYIDKMITHRNDEISHIYVIYKKKKNNNNKNEVLLPSLLSFFFLLLLIKYILEFMFFFQDHQLKKRKCEIYLIKQDVVLVYSKLTSVFIRNYFTIK